MPSRLPLITRLLLSFIALLIGVVLLAGGGWLAWIGGSSCYALGGLAALAIGVLLLRGSHWVYWAVALFNLVALAWAIFEAGLDWWQLAPRLDLVALFAAALAVLTGRDAMSGSRISRTGFGALAGSLVLLGAVAAISGFDHAHNVVGDLPRGRSAQADAYFAADKDWTAYGGTQAGTRYSRLDQITAQNVGQLQVAWTFHTGDVRGQGDPVETTYEVTPLKVDQTLYLCTPHDRVFALNAETGQEVWRYDPQIRQPPAQSTQHLTCRGLSYFDGNAASGSDARNAAPGAACGRRLFLPTVDGRLIALDAETGRPCAGFGGPDGAVDLWQNMPNVTPGSYYSTSPPVIADGLVIVGGAVNDNVSIHSASGVIRAFDVRSGALVWNWDSRNPDQTAPLAPASRYSESSPNSWSVSSYDPKLGLIYVPMGNQSPDQFGGNRDANVEKYSSAIVALRARTGMVAWVFQGTHHDLWDMDIPAQPSLVDLTIRGEQVPALVQATKQGELFVLDRRTGVPVHPVTEVAAPQGAADGDHTAASQPVSAISFNPAPLTERSMWGVTPFDQLACRIKFRSLRYEGRYTPPSLQGSIIYPGNMGVFNWGGVAIDADRQIAFTMPVEMAFTSTLKIRKDATSRLVTTDAEAPFNENFGARYAVKLAPLVSPLGKPCQAPPWGHVAGVDLATGKIAYRHVNGTVRDLSRLPLPFRMGVPGIGGPIVTRGGVAFLSGTMDYFLRAYDVTSGNQLWESRLPAGAQATPMTYWSTASNRQFVVVVAGGHGTLGTKAGDAIIAYALPRS